MAPAPRTALFCLLSSLPLDLKAATHDDDGRGATLSGFQAGWQLRQAEMQPISTRVILPLKCHCTALRVLTSVRLQIHLLYAWFKTLETLQANPRFQSTSCPTLALILDWSSHA